uniref:Uncharacterized protein n=1 Tax=Anguilla anguilla TaxID=7936 RepID=A0A0E9T7A0_ANGAN
MCQIVPTITLV